MGARERGSLDARYYLRTDGTFVELLDEDDMVSDDATKAPSQQSVKAYVDGQITATETYADDAVAAAFVWTYATAGTSSGTAFDFTSIPAGITEIEVMFTGVSLDGSDNIIVQIGDSGGFETTGYVSGSFNTAAAVSSTAGYVIGMSSAARAADGVMRIIRSEPTGVTWHSSHGITTTNNVVAGGGSKTLSAELTQVRVTRTGTDNFDAGTLHVRYR